MAPFDVQYDEIFAQFDDDLSESKEAELEKQLESLDAKISPILAEFGFVEPALTESQEKELENRLAPLDDQYYEIYGEEECDGHESDDESDEFHDEE